MTAIDDVRAGLEMARARLGTERVVEALPVVFSRAVARRVRELGWSGEGTLWVEAAPLVHFPEAPHVWPEANNRAARRARASRSRRQR